MPLPHGRERVSAMARLTFLISFSRMCDSGGLIRSSAELIASTGAFDHAEAWLWIVLASFTSLKHPSFGPMPAFQRGGSRERKPFQHATGPGRSFEVRDRE